MAPGGTATVPSILAWLLAIVFGTAGLEKLFLARRRRGFFEAARQAVPLPGIGGIAGAYLAGEVAAPALLWLRPAAGLALLVGLAAAVTLFAAVHRLRGREGDCGCGGLWAASGRNLLLRNAGLLAAALYAWRAAPVPLAPGAPWYALATLAAGLTLAGLAEAVRVRLETW